MEREVLHNVSTRSIVFNGLYVKGDGLTEGKSLLTEVCDEMLVLFER